MIHFYGYFWRNIEVYRIILLESAWNLSKFRSNLKQSAVPTGAWPSGAAEKTGFLEPVLTYKLSELNYLQKCLGMQKEQLYLAAANSRPLM